MAKLHRARSHAPLTKYAQLIRNPRIVTVTPMSESSISVEAQQVLDSLHLIVAQSGPRPDQYEHVSGIFRALERLKVPFDEVRLRLKPTLQTTNCIQGLGFLKPHGYSGDFEIIDRIHTGWVSSDPFLRRWDEYFHAQPAPRAVRNRKTYFHQTLDRYRAQHNSADNPWVLNLGAGPARDVFEYVCKSDKMNFQCVDFDDKAIEYGRNLCKTHRDRIQFSKQNALRVTSSRQYQLIWSSGLFDYFSDRIFRMVLRRLLRMCKPGGEIVIGNFCEDNPCRFWMEAAGDWVLEHRSRAALLNLALSVGVPEENVYIAAEPEGVNLFLHISIAHGKQVLSSSLSQV